MGNRKKENFGNVVADVITSIGEFNRQQEQPEPIKEPEREPEPETKTETEPDQKTGETVSVGKTEFPSTKKELKKRRVQLVFKQSTYNEIMQAVKYVNRKTRNKYSLNRVITKLVEDWLEEVRREMQ